MRQLDLLIDISFDNFVEIESAISEKSEWVQVVTNERTKMWYRFRKILLKKTSGCGILFQICIIRLFFAISTVCLMNFCVNGKKPLLKIEIQFEKKVFSAISPWTTLTNNQIIYQNSSSVKNVFRALRPF